LSSHQYVINLQKYNCHFSPNDAMQRGHTLSFLQNKRFNPVIHPAEPPPERRQIMTTEANTNQTEILWDAAALYAVAFGLFTPGALMAARQLAPVPVQPTQNATRSTR
jgi:hypothetical protein